MKLNFNIYDIFINKKRKEGETMQPTVRSYLDIIKQVQVEEGVVSPKMVKSKRKELYRKFYKMIEEMNLHKGKCLEDFLTHLLAQTCAEDPNNAPAYFMATALNLGLNYVGWPPLEERRAKLFSIIERFLYMNFDTNEYRIYCPEKFKAHADVDKPNPLIDADISHEEYEQIWDRLSNDKPICHSFVYKKKYFVIPCSLEDSTVLLGFMVVPLVNPKKLPIYKERAVIIGNRLTYIFFEVFDVDYRRRGSGVWDENGRYIPPEKRIKNKPTEG